MPRPPVKKTEKLAKAAELGKLRAEAQIKRNKTLKARIVDHVEKLIDSVHLDPLELGATFGATILVHGAIIESEELLKLVASTKGNVAAQIAAFAISPPAELIQWIMGTFAGNTSDLIQKFGLDQDWEIWLVSFAIAYILVHNAGALLGAITGVGSNLTSIIKMFLPAAPVAAAA